MTTYTAPTVQPITAETVAAMLVELAPSLKVDGLADRLLERLRSMPRPELESLGRAVILASAAHKATAPSPGGTHGR